MSAAAQPDWFAQNAPAPAAAPSSGGGDWFAQNSPKAAAPQDSAASRLGSNFLSGLGVTSDEQAKNFFAHPLDTVIKSFEAQGELAKKARDAYDKGDYMGALQHGLNYLVPFVGQQADQAGEQLKSGDIAGGVGRTLGAAVPIAAGSPEVQSAAGDAASAFKSAGESAVRSTARGANAALQKAPGIVGGAIGAAAGAKVAGSVGAELGGAAGAIAGRDLLPNVRIPGEGFGLPNRVTGGPANAPPYEPPPPADPALTSPSRSLPGQITPEIVDTELPIPGVNVRPSLHRVMDDRGLLLTGDVDSGPKSLAQLPPKAVHQAVQELGNKAAISDVTTRANQIAKLSDLLNQGLGGKALESGVTLRNQLPALKPGQAGSIAESVAPGHTPVDSTALKSYKYDPQAQEFHVKMNSDPNKTYVFGGIEPEDVAKFEAADSKGKAFHALKNSPGVQRTATIINGQRFPFKPLLSDEDSISPDEWEAGHALGTEQEGTARQ